MWTMHDCRGNGLAGVGRLSAAGGAAHPRLWGDPAGLAADPPGHRSTSPERERLFAGLPSTQLLGIAVLLGLSERFLNRIGAQAEEVVGTPASHPPTPARPASSRPPRSPPPWRPLPPTPTATSHRRATRPPAPRRNHSQPCRWNSRPRRRGACAGPTPPRSISRGGTAAVKSRETCRRRPRGDGDASHRQPFNQRQSFAIQDLRDATPGPGPTLASDSPARLTEPRARPREPTRTHARGRCRTRAGAAGWR